MNASGGAGRAPEQPQAAGDSVVRPRPVPPPPLEPQRLRSCTGTLWALLGILIGGVYILNPGLGLFELLPDNIPGVGNLDEAGAAALLIFGLRYLLVRRR